MISGDTDLARIKHIDPKAIILSGGPNSVHEGTSPVLPAGFFEYTDSNKLPVLGICYGMQLIAHTLGGKVAPSPSGGEFGRMSMKTEPKSTLFADEPSDTQAVWMSHGDDAVQLPPGFTCAARSMQVLLSMALSLCTSHMTLYVQSHNHTTAHHASQTHTSQGRYLHQTSRMCAQYRYTAR